MQSFAYVNPATVEEAVGQLAARWGEADVLAGGTDLISLMKENLHAPKRVVNIKSIKALEGIRKTAAGLRIGALVTMDELAKSELVRTSYAALAQAAAGIPSPQIRHMGTVGGDLCQRPRCWYYRDGFGLFATKDGKPLVPDGENKYHAIFGGGPAYFVSASSLGPALVALGARVKLVSAKGAREVAAALRKANGMHWIDAPVSGGPGGAREGALTVMAGGDAEDIAAIAPAMADLAANFTHVGPVGSGQTAKILNQAIVGTGYVLMAEALALAEAAGLDAARLPQCLAGGHADSNLLRKIYPQMAARDFEPPRGYARQLLKDMKNVRAFAREAGCELPVIEAAVERYAEYVGRGNELADAASISRLYVRSRGT